MPKPDDRARNDLARIHIAKKDLGLRDADYRAVVAGVMDRLGIPGPASAASLTAQGRSVLLGVFREMGWAPKKAPRPDRNAAWVGRYYAAGQRGEAGHLTQAQADEIARLEYELGWQDNPDRLAGFIERQTGQKKTVPMLRNRDASKVIMGLRKINAQRYLTT